ncbi:nuclear transport factor 2 family protein [Accumulibacter sp.]|uniref:nuclear transport factor 2 family protein n=1 Tax=Accumulibacter sp. TaxID=2053492 RepID=UPI001D2408C2|nr:nuclear transport factor 2 family protein [Accumulibacter sp.]MCB1966351.1 nuclear transport factor 2 family protein [Accumulibacter sp.]MCP5228529.1 nuclear transport factor 2 family protein [Accumulibacter sp.]
MTRNESAKVEDMCRKYVTALQHGDIEALLELFSDEASATSPISGRQLARDFYAYVMRVTSARSIVIKTIFIGTSEPLRAAIHLAYTRTVGNGEPATIEGVDVFELSKDGDKFDGVTIIYDTAPVRVDFDPRGA